MPTARELLEQADALMRRNRKRGRGRLDASTLTGVLDARAGGTVAPTVILPEVASDAGAIVLDRADDVARAAPEPPEARPHDDEMALDTLGDVPVLTDVVHWPADDEAEARAADRTLREPVAMMAATAADAFPASEADVAALRQQAPTIEVLERELDAAAPPPGDAETVTQADAAPADMATTQTDTQADPQATQADPQAGMQAPHEAGPHPAAAASADAPPFLDDDFILEIPPMQEARDALVAAPSASAASAPPTRTDAEWQGLAEEVRMQVLQRLDLFTDTGLREQLGARLSPIVERASAQLIETINRELGELVRGYVAEAIEREIETFRNRET